MYANIILKTLISANIYILSRPNMAFIIQRYHIKASGVLFIFPLSLWCEKHLATET